MKGKHPLSGESVPRNESEYSGQTPDLASYPSPEPSTGIRLKKRWFSSPVNIVITALGGTVAVLAAAVVLIAQPWVPASGLGGTPQAGEPRTETIAIEPLTVGDSYDLAAKTETTGRVESVTAKDPDLLDVNGTVITAKGEYPYTTVTVEAETLVQTVEDPSAMDSLRTTLRDWLGIEEKQTQLTTYIFEIKISGCPVRQSDQPIELTETDPTASLTLPGNYAAYQAQPAAPARATAVVEGAQLTLALLEPGETTVQVRGGFLKQADAKVLENYADLADQDGNIFVAVSAWEYTIVSEISVGPVGGGESSNASSAGGSSQPGGQSSASSSKQSSAGSSTNSSTGASSSTGANSSTGTSSGGSQPAAGTMERKILDLVNAARADAGLNPLSWNYNLNDAAALRAYEASVEWSHTRPDGTDCFTASPLLHGENLAAGYTTIETTFEGWMNSAGHRSNILNASFKSMSVALYISPNPAATDAEVSHYWAQLFSYN